MLDTNYSLRWESYNKNLCNGFSKLQQMQEFIDVTLAAGGHLIGAHQNILALASPYFKEMLKSAPCRHPVIFLGHMNHVTLAFLLEYIYTGEVKIPSHILPSFVEASKMLHIIGVSDIKVPENLTDVQNRIPQEFGTHHNSTSTMVVPEQLSDNEEHVNEHLYVMEDSNPPQILSDLNHGESLDSSNQLIENIRPMDSIADITVGKGNQMSMQTLAVDERLPSQFAVSDNTTTPSNEITNTQTSHLGSINIVTNSINETFAEPTSDVGNYIYQDEGSVSTYNRDCKMETDFENLIESKIIESDPTKKIASLQMEHSFGNNPLREECVQPENNAFKVDVPTDAGVITVCNVIPSASVNDESTKVEHSNTTIIPPLYTRSTRGSSEMILNRYIYNLHHTSCGGRKRRWRCIDYRKNRCLAYVDTFNGDIVARKNTHNHSFHDDKIMKFGRTKQLFTSISSVDKLFPVKIKGNPNKKKKSQSKVPSSS